jgi:hypothetical protein
MMEVGRRVRKRRSRVRRYWQCGGEGKRKEGKFGGGVGEGVGRMRLKLKQADSMRFRSSLVYHFQ